MWHKCDIDFVYNMVRLFVNSHFDLCFNSNHNNPKSNSIASTPLGTAHPIYTNSVLQGKTIQFVIYIYKYISFDIGFGVMVCDAGSCSHAVWCCLVMRTQHSNTII